MQEGEVVLTGPVDSELAFGEAVHAGIETAREEGVRELTFCDPHFGFWPLSQDRVLSSLTAFLKVPGRRLTLLAQDYEHLRRRHPKFVRWRQVWGHVVSPLNVQSPTTDLPCLLLADRRHALLLPQADAWSGDWITERERVLALQEKVVLWKQQAQPDLAINVTGL